mgnify:CR=1 FL=1
MTVDQFERALGDFGETMSNLSPILTQIGGRLVDQIKQDAPTNTGALRQSIKAVIQDDSLAIEMLYYGIFQNYGVDGDPGKPATDVPRFGVPQPEGGGRHFAFPKNAGEMIGGGLSFGARKQIYKMGLKPQNFFDIDDISTIVSEGVAEALTQEF